MAIRKNTNRLRILHVIGDSRFGGVAAIILGLAGVARDAGWQVDILTTDPTVQESVRQCGFGIVNLDVIRRPIRALWDLGGLFRLTKFLRAERYDLVHTHTSKGGFIGRLAATLARVPVTVHTVHGFAFHETSPAHVRFAYSALERLASHWCERIVTVSHFHRDWAIRLRMCGPRKITAIPNGIPEPLRNPGADPTEVRRRLGLQPGDLLLLTVSRLAPDKGLEYLLKAAAKLPSSGRRLLFAIAGDGPAQNDLVRQAATLGIADRAIFLGFCRDIPELLAAADIVILPSLREGLSISLLEAMAAAKPIIASSIGSQREVASHGEIAVLVRPGDAESLRDAIVGLTGDPSQMSRLAARAREVYELHYTEQQMLRSYRNLYFELLNFRADLAPGSVRPATVNDLSTIIAIHHEAFDRFFLTRLGPEFLRRYYNLVLNYTSGILLVAEGPDGVNGFACGFLNPAEFYRRMWHSKATFAVPVFSAMLLDPSLIGKLFWGVRRIQTGGSGWPAQSCELSSIAVAPGTAGNGFGKALIQAFLARAQSMDAHCVYLTTDADGNDAVNAFYRNVGFQHNRRFLQGEGRWMNEYVINGWEARNSCCIPV